MKDRNGLPNHSCNQQETDELKPRIKHNQDIVIHRLWLSTTVGVNVVSEKRYR